MELTSKEHYELMADFERIFSKGYRLDREKNKDFWKIGHVYEDGKTNLLFTAFRSGYQYGRHVERMESTE